MIRSACLLLVTVLWSLQSCKVSKSAGGEGTTLKDTYWRLTELMGKPVTKVPKGKREVYIRLITDGKRLESFAGCNSVDGGYEIHSGNKIHFSNLTETMMACDDLATESSLLEVLKTADRYELNDDELVLSKGKMVPLARFTGVPK